jgi:hypothetical protein
MTSDIADFTVILSVPHYICGVPYPENSHECDFTAGVAADTLNKQFNDVVQQRHTSKQFAVNPVLLKGDIARAYVDLNRRPARTASGTSMRTRLSSMLKSSNPKTTLLLDVHSYPADYRGWVGTDMAILDSDWRDVTLGYQLYSALFDDRIVINYSQTGLVNDIMDEAVFDHKIDAALLEFNEGNNINKTRRLARLIVKNVYKYIIEHK